MIQALVWHTWLLITFRHDGRGLPSKHLPTYLFLIALSAVVAAIKGGIFLALRPLVCLEGEMNRCDSDTDLVI